MGQRLNPLVRFLITVTFLASFIANPTFSLATTVSLDTNTNRDEGIENADPTLVPEDSASTVHFTSQSSPESTEPPTVNFVPQTVSYQAEFVTQNAYPRLTSGQSYQFTVTLRNSGTAAWVPELVHLGTDRPRDRISSFIREDIIGDNPSGWVKENRVGMAVDLGTGLLMGDVNINGLIDPSETATFSFWLSVPPNMLDGFYREYFNLVADHVTWFNDLGIFWEITIDNRPHARFIDQNPYPPTLTGGDSYEFWVRFENTGLIPWKDNGPNPVHLGTDRDRDRIPGFVREDIVGGSISGWVKENRVKMDRDSLTGKLIGDVNDNDQIDPSEIARFRFWYTVPETMESGIYQEYFRPVMDNRDHGWMEDYGVFWANVVDHIAPRPASVRVQSQVNQISVSWMSSEEATSYKVRYRPVSSTGYTVLDYPAAITTANIEVTGGQAFEVGVASMDEEGVSPFTLSTVYVESPAEAQARVAREMAREEERRRLVEEARPPEIERPTEPVVVGPPPTEEIPRDWRQFWLTLLVIIGAAGLATAGYYGYEWWVESRRQPRLPRRPLPPKREEPPKPPSPPTTRW